MENPWNTVVTFLTDTSPIHGWLLLILCLGSIVFMILWCFASWRNNKLKLIIHDSYAEIDQMASCHVNDEKKYEERLKNIATDSDIYNKRWHEALAKLAETEEELSIAENRTACAEGKLRKFDTKMCAMDYAYKLLKNDEDGYTTEDVKRMFETISECLKK